MQIIQETRDALLFARRTHSEAIEEIDKAVAHLDKLDGMKLESRMNAHQLVKAYMSKLGTSQTPAGVYAELRAIGHAVTTDAVAQAMHRLAKQGVLSKGGQCHYVWNNEFANEA